MTSPRPEVNAALALELLSKHFAVATVEESSVKEFVSYDDRNFFVRACLEGAASTEEFVLKVIHEKFSRNDEILVAQETVMEHLHQRGFLCPVPIRTRDGRSHAYESLAHSLYSEPPRSAVRLLRFVPGQVVSGREHLSDELLFSIGRYAARMHNALEVSQRSSM